MSNINEKENNNVSINNTSIDSNGNGDLAATDTTTVNGNGSLDATDTTTIHQIPFKYNGAYQTGSLTIRGTGASTYAQSFQLIHTVRCVPISIYTDGNNQLPTDYAPAQSDKYSNLFFLFCRLRLRLRLD